VSFTDQAEDTTDIVRSVGDSKFTKERVQWRRQQMKSLCDINHNVTPEETSRLSELLASQHEIVSLEEGE